MVKTNKTRQLQLKCYSAICLFSVKCSRFLELKRLKSLDKVLGGGCFDLIKKNQRWSHSNLNCDASKFAFSEDVKTFLKDCCSGVCFSTSRMLTMKGGRRKLCRHPGQCTPQPFSQTSLKPSNPKIQLFKKLTDMSQRLQILSLTFQRVEGYLGIHSPPH